MKKIYDFFRKFGLTEIEASIYLSLLEMGPSSVLEIAKKTAIKRSTVHVNIESLIQKGLVSETREGAKRRLVAEPPETIKSILMRQKADFEKIENDFNSIISDVYKTIKVRPEKLEYPIIRYCQGLDGFKEVCQRSLTHSDKEILFLSNIDEWYKVYTEEFDREYYIPTRLDKKIFMKVLTFETPVSKEMREKDDKLYRSTKFLAGNASFLTTTIIYNNEVSMMLASEPYTAIIIESKEFYETFLSIFRRLWRTSY